MGVLEEKPIQNEMQMLMKFTRFENGQHYGVQGTRWKEKAIVMYLGLGSTSIGICIAGMH